MKFNQKLIELRKKKGLSQEELGYELSVTRQTISKWELGLSTPDMDKLMEISRFFNISIDDLTNENKSTNNYSTNNSSRVNPEFVGVNTDYIPEDQKNKQYVEGPKKHSKLLMFLPLILGGLMFITILIIGLAVGIETSKEHTSQKNTQLSFDVRSYNSSIESYKGLQSDVSTNNMIEKVISKPDEVKDVTVIYSDIEAKSTSELISLRNKIIKDEYLISFEYGNEGYINKIIIQDIPSNDVTTENNTTNNTITNNTSTPQLSLDITFYNSKIESKKGTTSGFFIRTVIDDVINKPSEVKDVTISYNEIEAKSESELNNLKNKFPNSTGKNYSLSFEYGDEGYINKITITDIN